MPVNVEASDTNLTQLFGLEGRLAVITGGGTGLGKRMAQVLSRVGATVVLSARRVDKLEATAAAIVSEGGRALCIPMDVTSGESVASAFNEIAKHGTASIIINNAGTVAEPALLNLSESEWQKVFDTNLKGAWMVGREAVRHLINAKSGGSVINITSVLGSAVQKGTGPYATSKAGLLHLTRSMALEWARYEVRVNALSPGYFHTDMASEFLDSSAGEAMVKRIPQRRLGNPPDLDGAVLLLASDASRYMTGTEIVVDGGHSMATL